MRAAISSGIPRARSESGATLFYGSKAHMHTVWHMQPELCFYLILGRMKSRPSQLQRVCVGSPTSSAQQTLGRLNISWDPLSCHLQNGADIAEYIIQYTRLPNGTPSNISISDSRLECHQVADYPYSCLANRSLFISDEIYRFQVAVQNGFGVGSFSNPVIFVYSSQGKVLLHLY